ncbi:MAG: hypothetical protein U0K86_07900 [Agathobacter sp.]|nr:hypothetical protein [Agathobacter sp.]
MNDEIRFEDFKLAFISLWKRKFLIILISLVAFLIGILVTITADSKNTYSAMSSVYGAIYGSYEESTDATSAMLSYADVLTTKKVCERAESILGNSNITANDIQEMISSEYSSDSIILKIWATSDDPETSVNVANAVGEAFVIEMKNIIGSDAIQMLDYADKYFVANDGVKSLWTKRLLFGLVGFAGSCIVFFVLELFTDKLKSVEQCVFDENDVILAILPEEDK